MIKSLMQPFVPSPRLGLIFTLLGAGLFIPDALLVRLAGAPVMDFALWRGLIGAVVTLAATAIFARGAIPSWRQFLSWPTLALVLAQGLGSLFYLLAIGHTSVANALLLYASSPFLAALMGYVFLKERISRFTMVCMLAVFAGVLVIGMGSMEGRIWGDLSALANAVAAGAYYVILRRAGPQSLIVAAAFGYLATALIALPFASFVAFTPVQWGLVTANGALCLALGAAIQMIGPRHLPAAEVSMLTMIEIVGSPLLVWAFLGEAPPVQSLIGGAVILAALLAHGAWRLRVSAAGI